MVLVAAVAPAHANPFEIVGLGSRRAALAQSGVASVDDMAALYYDPAGLVIRNESELALGLTAVYSHLAIDRVRAPLADGGGMQIGMRMRLHRRFAAGLAIHSAPRGTQLEVRNPAVPFYPQFRDRLSRSVVLAGVALDLKPAAVGVAFDLLDGFTHARAIVGAMYPLDTLRLGVTYHQRFALVDERARVHYSPHRVDIGIAYTEGLIASLDLGWANWSPYNGPFALDRVDYDDTFSVRFGLESGTTGIIFRGGYAFETSPVKTLLDGGKHTIAYGVGYTYEQLRIDGHTSVQIVGTRSLTEPVEVKGGGEVLIAGFTLTAGF